MATCSFMDTADDQHWAHYDEDESEELSRSEFYSLVEDVLTAHDLVLVEHNFKRTFRDYDEDGSGSIKREEADELILASIVFGGKSLTKKKQMKRFRNVSSASSLETALRSRDTIRILGKSVSLTSSWEILMPMVMARLIKTKRLTLY